MRPCLLPSWDRSGDCLSAARRIHDEVNCFEISGSATDCCGGEWTYGADYLGPQYAGVRLNVAEGRSLPFVAPPAGQILPEEQRSEFSLLGKLNALSGIDYPDDQELRARIRSYELAFGMQTAVPDAVGWKLISVVRSTRSLPEPTFRCWLSQTKLVKCQVAWAVICPCSVAAVFPGIFSSNQVPPGAICRFGRVGCPLLACDVTEMVATRGYWCAQPRRFCSDDLPGI